MGTDLGCRRREVPLEFCFEMIRTGGELDYLEVDNAAVEEKASLVFRFHFLHRQGGCGLFGRWSGRLLGGGCRGGGGHHCHHIGAHRIRMALYSI